MGSSKSSSRKRDLSPDSTDSEQEQSDDVLVLSHAAKRKQKKALSKPAIPSKKQKKGDTPSPHLVKRQNSIWIGNLCYKTTAESLRRFFGDVGEITRVHLPTKVGKASPGEPVRRENRGFAYVDFSTPEAKNAAITMSESPLEGRRLLIKDGDSFLGRPAKPGMSLQVDGLGAQGKGHSKFAQKILSAQKQPPAPTLFFGNLGFETTVDSIRGLLEAHRAKEEKSDAVAVAAAASSSESATKDVGEDRWIRKIRMGTFEDSGLCKGFAFVDFTSTKHATAALIHPKNHQLDGRGLVVEYASADAVRRGGGGGHRPKKISTEVSGEGHAGVRRKRRDPEVDDRADEKARSTATTTRAQSHEEKSTAAGGRDRPSAKWKNNHGTRKSRTTPGAALAQAKREQVAIVPSQGRRITFDD
ncbi:hypothetical protein F5148DRAFT_295223 [Russula earlei]|uniref:Uncharacterized protein n=1 Tax=Russula earlei TaxID=71964 RepID=A0ACC0UPD2_9AGAM|nr:hypothetical protein F5148DRAFT_295223 [Russula earlei]